MSLGLAYLLGVMAAEADAEDHSDDDNSSDSDGNYPDMDSTDVYSGQSDSDLDFITSSDSGAENSDSSDDRTTLEYNSSDSNDARPVIIETSEDDMEVEVIENNDDGTERANLGNIQQTNERADRNVNLVAVAENNNISQPARPYFTQEGNRLEQNPQIDDPNVSNSSVNTETAAPEPENKGEPEAKRAKIESNSNSCDRSLDDDGQSCPICFESWTTSGEHRLVSLHCGHLFGKLCIEKWMKNSSTSARSIKGKCPQCNAVAKKNDIRPIYARCLKVLDTSERDRAMKKLEEEQEKRKKMELEKNQTVLQLQLTVDECNKLKREIIEQKNIIEELRYAKFKNGRNGFANGLSKASCSQVRPKSIFKLEKIVELCKDGGCRLLASSKILPLILATQRSKIPMFPGYGVRKISTLDFQPAEYMFLHSKEIKDIAFHSHDSLILSSSMDKTVKLSNVRTNTIVQTYPMEMEAWSCAWNTEAEQSHTFYVGLRNGSVLEMDTRMPPNSVQTLTPPILGSSNSPVVRLQYIRRNYMKEKGCGGLFALQLSTSCFYESKLGGKFNAHPLSLKGSFTSLSLEPATGHILISSRPSPKQGTVKHMLCELSPTNSVIQEPSQSNYYYTCNVLNSVDGGPIQAQITRSQLFLDPDTLNAPLVCAGDEASQSALIWDLSSGVRKETLEANLPVLDVLNFNSGRDFCMATLTKESVRFYKYHNYSI